MALAELRRVTAATLVLIGDRDMVSVEHAAAMVQELPDGQLGVIPGATHGLPMEKPDIVNTLILEFLANEPAVRLGG
jgi:pimeloyl-ACP methyl ester carboxylesterase